MADKIKQQPDPSSNPPENQEQSVLISAEQEMLSDTDQVDLETALHGMNIPIADEGNPDEEDFDQG